jgi:hypothetical protein
MLGAAAASTEATAWTSRPVTRGRLRPNASESGPITSWPNARPPSIPVSVSWVAESEAFRSAASAGNAGRYMSMVIGPSAMSAPSTSTSWT